jgi:hypothetical protein
MTYEEIELEEGLIFVTYSSLIAGATKKKRQGRKASRLEQLIAWCGGSTFEGLILMDECHRAKNFVLGKRSTKTGNAVFELQQTLPKARVVYCSATGITNPINMGYMTRLGLWGLGTPFPLFADFLQVVEKAMGMMELAVS